MSLLNNWKTKAVEKSAAMQHNKEDVEVAFMDQAYSYIQNKAGRLLSDPHRLGFEIVYKNEANTRLVGMFAFRANGNLLYAPTFFVNGEVKGTDLLYQQDRKMFCPLTEEWVEYLLETNNQDQGKGYNDRRNMNRQLDVRKLVLPPSNRGFYEKGASVELPIQEVMTEMAKSAALKPILREFMLDAGLPALDALEKMASTSFTFAEALATLDYDTFAPEGIGQVQETKEASEAPGELVLITSFGEFSKEASVQDTLIKRGFDMADNRKNTTAVEVSDIELQSVSETGTYDVLCADGSVSEAMCLVGAEKKQAPCGNDFESYEPGGSYPYSHNHCGNKCLILYKDGTTCDSTCDKVFGTLKKSLDEAEKASTGSTGKTYCLYSPSANAYAFAKVQSKREREGITTYVLSDSPKASKGDSWELVVKDEPCDASFCGEVWTAGDDLMFLTIKPSKSDYSIYPEHGKSVGGSEVLDQFLLSNKMVPAKLSKSEKSAGTRYTLKVNGRTTEDMGSQKMAVKMAAELRISRDDTFKLMDSADTSGSVKFYLYPDSLEKSGGMRMLENPEFTNEYDDEFNVPMDPGHAYRLGVDSDQEPFPAQRLGDMQQVEGGQQGYDDEDSIPHDTLMQESPEAIAQLAKSKQVSNVFEHGVVGALTNSTNAMTLIERYTPDLEKALDSIGRSLFLFYWKPGEFQDAYGVDDMQNLEDELLSTFKVLGDLTLNLIKKSPKRPVGLTTANTSV